MDTKSSYSFILIGLCVRLLRNVDGNDSSEFVSEHIDRLTYQLEKVNFRVSLSGLTKIQEINNELKKFDKKKLTDLDNKESVLDYVYRINREMELLERVIYAEAETKNVYTLPERRFNSEFLLNEPQKILKKGVFEKLTKIAKNDFRSSCRCLLFGEATAAAFHVLRATEEVLRLYYSIHKKRNRLKKPMWGPMTLELRKKTRNKPPSVTLDSLDLVKDMYRNPTQHPDAVYDIESAQDLLGVCIDLINKMAEELHAEKLQSDVDKLLQKL